MNRFAHIGQVIHGRLPCITCPLIIGVGMGWLPWWGKGSASVKKGKGKYIHL